MSSSKFPTEYAIIADIPVTLTVDPRKLTRSPAKRTFKSPDEIFTYDDKEEKRIVEEFGGRGTGTGTAVTETGTAVTKSTPKSVPKSISPPVRPEVKNSPPPTTEDIIGKLTDRVKNVSLTKGTEDEKATELSLLYLPDETKERQEQFARLYKSSRSLSGPPPDMDILRAFFLFEGEEGKALDYLKGFISLKELGFPEDQISTALLLYKNNVDEALDHLMKN